MSIMSLLSIEKAREECFVLVGVNRFGVIVRVFQHITVCALNRWEDYGNRQPLENPRDQRKFLPLDFLNF